MSRSRSRLAQAVAVVSAVVCIVARVRACADALCIILPPTCRSALLPSAALLSTVDVNLSIKEPSRSLSFRTLIVRESFAPRTQEQRW